MQPVKDRPVISREAAYMQNKRRYYLGTACRNGHTAERYVSNGVCVDCLGRRFKYRINSYSHELQPFAPTQLWVPKAIPPDRYDALEAYLQVCVREFTNFHGLLTPDVEDALNMQIECMPGTPRTTGDV